MAMSTRGAADLLWFRVWWEYPRPHDSWVSVAYHGFNLFEGACWVVFGILVVRRYLVSGRSALEILYALTFLSFGGTDFREAYVLQAWLIWVKLVNLIGLLMLRRLSMKYWHPESRLY